MVESSNLLSNHWFSERETHNTKVTVSMDFVVPGSAFMYNEVYNSLITNLLVKITGLQ